MSLTASPVGFKLRSHPSGQTRANAYKIDPAYTTAIGKDDAVVLNTNGTIQVAAAAADFLGTLAGVEYIDPTGKPTCSPNWPGLTGCTNIVAYVYDDPLNIFEAQFAASASGFVQAAVGDQTDLVAGTPNAATGQSTMAINATLKGAGVQGQWRIIGFGPDGVYDATNNPFPTALVQNARHQFVAVKVAI